MKKNALFLGMILINLHLFSQNVSVDKLKQENQKLENQISNLQKKNDSIRNEAIALKQDTTFLRKEILLCSLYGQANKIETSNSNSNYKFSFISCKGNRAAQQVVVTFMVEHVLPNQKFEIGPGTLDKAIAYDSQGHNFSTYLGSFGGNNVTNGEIPTNIPIICSLIFNNVLPGNDLFKVVNMNYNSRNLDYSNEQKGTVEFRNLKIIWD